MTAKSEAKPAIAAVNELFLKGPDGLREIVRAVMQEMLEAEMTDALGAEKGERTEARLGYRSGYYSRTLVTRVGKLELRVPQDRNGRFSTELFERYQRSEQALVATLAEMYVQGVSTRKVRAITEELCGHAFSASAISAINKRRDESLDAFARRPLAEPFPYLILDARYEKVREGGVVMSQAVLIAIGIDWDGRRQILAVDMANSFGIIAAAVSTFSGGITNNGAISARDGIIVGFTSSSGIGTFSGGVTNTGVITAARTGIGVQFVSAFWRNHQ
jgi:putative transposase